MGAKLQLSEKEKCDVTIGRKAIEEALMGFHYCMVAKVLTDKEVNRETFIDRFTSLWRGRDGVSIREVGEQIIFLARFISKKDMFRVIDAEKPWMFKEALVMVAHRAKKGYRC